MSENSIKTYQDFKYEAMNELLSQIENLNQEEKTLLTFNIIKKLDKNQMGEIHQFIQPRMNCNIILALHKCGHSKIVKEILNFLDTKSLVNLESTCYSLFSVVRLHLCWKSLIEEKISNEHIWGEIVRRRGWIKYFRFSDIRQVKNHDFYRNMYPIILKEIYNLDKRWRKGQYSVNRVQFMNTNGVYCLQYDDNKIVSGHRDDTVKFWNIKKKRIDKLLVGHTGSVLCLQFDGQKVITGSSDCTIRVWDIKTGKQTQLLKGHTQAVLYLKFDEKILVTCSKDCKAIVWSNDPQEGYVELCKLTRHDAAVNVIDFDDSYIVTASGDRFIVVWSRETFDIKNVLVGHRRGIACLHQRGKIVASGSSDKTIRIWDIEEGRCLKMLVGHTDLVRCIRFNDNYIVSGSYDCKIKIWDFKSIMSPHNNKTDYCISTLQEHTGRVFRLMFDDFQIMTCSHDDTIVIWNFFNSNTTYSISSPFN